MTPLRKEIMKKFNPFSTKEEHAILMTAMQTPYTNWDDEILTEVSKRFLKKTAFQVVAGAVFSLGVHCILKYKWPKYF